MLGTLRAWDSQGKAWDFATSAQVVLGTLRRGRTAHTFGRSVKKGKLGKTLGRHGIWGREGVVYWALASPIYPRGGEWLVCVPYPAFRTSGIGVATFIFVFDILESGPGRLGT